MDLDENRELARELLALAPELAEPNADMAAMDFVRKVWERGFAAGEASSDR